VEKIYKMKKLKDVFVNFSKGEIFYHSHFHGFRLGRVSRLKTLDPEHFSAYKLEKCKRERNVLCEFVI